MAPIIAGIKAVASIVIPLTGGLTVGKLVATVAISYGIGKLLQKDPDPRKTPISRYRQMAKRPNPARVCFYGRATNLAPQLIVATTAPGHHSLVGAIADHPIERIVDIKFNSQPFFTAAELVQLRENNYLHMTGRGDGNQGQLRGSVDEARGGFGDGRYYTYRGSAFSLYYDWKFGGAAFMGLSLDGDGSKTKQRVDQWNGVYDQPYRPHQRIHDPTPVYTPDGYAGQIPSFKMSGCAWMYFGMLRTPHQLIERDGKRPVWNSVPNITFDVERSNLTLVLPRNTDGVLLDGIDYKRGNAALCLHDYIFRYTPMGREVFGVKRLDDQSFIDAAEVCERNNWTCNGAFSLEDPPSSVIEEILAAMGGGSISVKDGVLFAHAGGSSPITQVCNEDDVQVSTPVRSKGGSVADRVAAVEVNYIDKDGEDQSVRVDYDANLPYTTYTRTEASFIQTQAQAEAHARNILRRAWDSEGMEFYLLAQEKTPDPWDRIRIKVSDIGLDHDIRVTSVEKLPDGRVRVAGVREDDNFYDVKRDSNYVPPPRRTIPPPVVPPQPGRGGPNPTLPPPVLPPTTPDDDLLLVRINNQDQTIDIAGAGKLRV